MKITIHINHTEADDLAAVESAARGAGLVLTRRGDFMGRCHTEISGEMSPSALADLLDAAPQISEAA